MDQNSQQRTLRMGSICSSEPETHELLPSSTQSVSSSTCFAVASSPNACCCSTHNGPMLYGNPSVHGAIMRRTAVWDVVLCPRPLHPLKLASPSLHTAVPESRFVTQNRPHLSSFFWSDPATVIQEPRSSPARWRLSYSCQQVEPRSRCGQSCSQ